MSEIVAITKARELRNRLWNPPNARYSTELDVVTEPELRRRRMLELKQRKEAERAEQDFLRQSALDELMRRVLAEHGRAKTIAARFIIEEDMPQPPKLRDILLFVSKAYNIRWTDILSHRRDERAVNARMVVAYLARTLTFLSTTEIGRRMNSRDHTTILHSVKRVEERMLADERFRNEIAGFQRQIIEVE